MFSIKRRFVSSHLVLLLSEGLSAFFPCFYYMLLRSKSLLHACPSPVRMDEVCHVTRLRWSAETRSSVRQ